MRLRVLYEVSEHRVLPPEQLRHAQKHGKLDGLANLSSGFLLPHGRAPSFFRLVFLWCRSVDFGVFLKFVKPRFFLRYLLSQLIGCFPNDIQRQNRQRAANDRLYKRTNDFILLLENEKREGRVCLPLLVS